MAKDSRPPADTRSIARLREHIYPTKQYTNIVIGIIWNVNSALHIEVLQSKMLKRDPQNERAGARRTGGCRRRSARGRNNGPGPNLLLLEACRHLSSRRSRILRRRDHWGAYDCQ